MFTIFVTPVEKLTAIVEIEDFPTGLGTSTRLVILKAAASLVAVVLLLLLLSMVERGVDLADRRDEEDKLVSGVTGSLMTVENDRASNTLIHPLFFKNK